MYTLEFYDKAYTNESRLIFSRKLSPREILQAVNKWSFYEWKGKIDDRAYKALMNYTVEITD